MAEDAFVEFIVKVVRDREFAARFVKSPKKVLAAESLSRKERKLLRKGRFRKDICAFLAGRGNGGRDPGG